MSASVSAMWGGQPSTTQPIAAPWLSPNVVTLKRWPKVLNDIGFHPLRCGSPRARCGQMAARDRNSRQRTAGGTPRSGVAREQVAGEHVDHALVDGMMRGLLRWCERQVCNEGTPGAAMGGNHGISVQRCVPLAYSGGDLRIAFTEGRPEPPLVRFTPGDDVLLAGQHISVGQAFPFAE